MLHGSNIQRKTDTDGVSMSVLFFVTWYEIYPIKRPDPEQQYPQPAFFVFYAMHPKQLLLGQ